VQPAEDGGHLLALHQLARDGHALLRIALVVAHDELELAPAQHAAPGVDLVDGDDEAAADRLPGGGRAAGDGGGEADLHGRLLGAQRRCGKDGDDDGENGECTEHALHGGLLEIAVVIHRFRRGRRR
jgi:hypothetical protein